MRILIKARPTTPQNTVKVTPSAVVVRSRPMRVLDFDVEARPLHWISGDYVSKEITAIAWAWCDAPEHVECRLLGEVEPVQMLQDFCDAYAHADMVTGHFILGYDLGMVMGALTEYSLPPLGDKMVQDTKVHLVKRAGLSVSQENLGAMLRLEHPKIKMDQAKWRDANRLTPEGRALARERVMGDVRQHIELRHRLLALGYLCAPSLWRSGSAQSTPEYTP